MLGEASPLKVMMMAPRMSGRNFQIEWAPRTELPPLSAVRQMRDSVDPAGETGQRCWNPLCRAKGCSWFVEEPIWVGRNRVVYMR